MSDADTARLLALSFREINIRRAYIDGTTTLEQLEHSIADVLQQREEIHRKLTSSDHPGTITPAEAKASE